MHWLVDRLMPWQFHRRVQQGANDLIAAYGPHAYTVARQRARLDPRAERGSRDRFWTAVALAIADIEGREIGVKGADRWPGS